jgi:hypothetical protein
LLVTLAQAPSNADLKRAEELAAEYKYAEARAALQKARASKGLDRGSLLKVLELTGVVAAQLKQADKAQAAFRELLILDPTRTLSGEYAPKVMTPFLEAQKQVKESGGLELDAEVATAPGRVDSITVKVKRDPLGVGEQVRFHVQSASGAWRALAVPLTDYQAVLPTGGSEVYWWAELLGANEVQLALLGSPTEPRAEKVKLPEPAQVAEAAPAPTKIIKIQETQSPLRPISYVLVGGALVAAGGGAYFGVRSSEAFTALDKVERDDQGRVTNLTERQAYELDKQGKEHATIANVLFISAGALAATGIVLWIVGMPKEVEVAIGPAPGGVVFAGTLP